MIVSGAEKAQIFEEENEVNNEINKLHRRNHFTDFIDLFIFPKNRNDVFH